MIRSYLTFRLIWSTTCSAKNKIYSLERPISLQNTFNDYSKLRKFMDSKAQWLDLIRCSRRLTQRAKTYLSKEYNRKSTSSGKIGTYS